MATGKLLSDVLLAAASALAGGLLIALALVAAFAAVGRMLLLVRRARAQGHARAGRPAASGAAVAAD